MRMGHRSDFSPLIDRKYGGGTPIGRGVSRALMGRNLGDEGEGLGRFAGVFGALLGRCRGGYGQLLGVRQGAGLGAYS